MSLTYILVDFDNVKPTAADIGLARGDKYRLAVVRGPQQTRYEADLAEALHSMGSQVTFTRCAKAGKNAADMQIAFLLGELVATMPASAHRTTRFVVISRDKDFDPLLMYLHDKGFDATRAASFKAALGGKAAAEPEAKPPADACSQGRIEARRGETGAGQARRGEESRREESAGGEEGRARATGSKEGRARGSAHGQQTTGGAGPARPGHRGPAAQG